MRRQRPAPNLTLLPREEKLLAAFPRRRTFCCADARQAMKSKYADWYIRRLRNRGLVRKIARDLYEVR